MSTTEASIVLHETAEKLRRNPECERAMMLYLGRSAAHTLRKSYQRHLTAGPISSSEQENTTTVAPPPNASLLLALLDHGHGSPTSLEYDVITRIVMTFIITTLTIVGVIGNLLVVLVVKRVPGMVS